MSHVLSRLSSSNHAQMAPELFSLLLKESSALITDADLHLAHLRSERKLFIPVFCCCRLASSTGLAGHSSVHDSSCIRLFVNYPSFFRGFNHGLSRGDLKSCDRPGRKFDV